MDQLGWLASCCSVVSGEEKRASNCLSDILKYVWNQPGFTFSSPGPIEQGLQSQPAAFDSSCAGSHARLDSCSLAFEHRAQRLSTGPTWKLATPMQPARKASAGSWRGRMETLLPSHHPLLCSPRSSHRICMRREQKAYFGAGVSSPRDSS